MIFLLARLQDGYAKGRTKIHYGEYITLSDILIFIHEDQDRQDKISLEYFGMFHQQKTYTDYSTGGLTGVHRYCTVVRIKT